METVKKIDGPDKSQEQVLNSAFYIGSVFHKRFKPKVHKFNYPLYMAFVDLDEVEELNSRYWWFSSRRWAPLQLKSTDYFRSIAINKPQNNVAKDGISINVDQSGQLVCELKNVAISTAKSLGADVEAVNRVCMLAQLRSFGIYFSPVNFFFLYEGDDARYLVAEVSNTPWNEKYCYLIDIKHPKLTPKDFHVSPFMDLNMSYQWSINPPEKDTCIRINNQNEKVLFSAVFSAKRYEINSKTMRKIFLKWPVVTVVIVRLIYWQAARLIIKGVKFVPYQKK